MKDLISIAGFDTIPYERHI